MSKARLLIILLTLTVLFTPVMATAQVIFIKNATNKIAQPDLPPQTVILTFDDGPSSYTPQILDILKDKGVKATFFVIGNQAVNHPLLGRINQEGHEIGNHTYTHPDLAKIPEWRRKLELNLTRIVISSQTHHGSRLLRLPYQGSDQLRNESIHVAEQAGDWGYITVGETLDSQDWKQPGTEQIISNASRDSSGIILLHDGGGDRRQTVDALPGIIEYYQNNGYKFATVSEALGLARNDIMPPLSPMDKVLATLADLIFTVSRWISRSWHWLILLLIIASIIRFFLVTAAALVQSRRKYFTAKYKLAPCSVLIPAYNETAVIRSCIQSVLASDYDNFEVLVIDDGSKDDTYEKAFEINDSRLRVIRKTNGGKASALNYGIAQAKHDFLVAIDADTIFRPATLTKLMRHFTNQKVGAVSGNTKIVNRHKLITKLQSLEYIVGFNLDRRMGDLFDCITVVPGAVGAFRRTTLERAGGFTIDTLAEDTDLTLSIKELGYKIVYDAEAIALTEAPSNTKDLLKQRFRWTFGTMQAVWKHRGSFLNPKRGTLGMVGLPYLFFFQIFFPLFSPLFDIAVVIALITHQNKLVLISFVIYTLADFITSIIALRLDKEKLSNAWIIIPQRILYRQLMYYVIARSFVNVLRGRLVHWGKLERQGEHLAKNV